MNETIGLLCSRRHIAITYVTYASSFFHFSTFSVFSITYCRVTEVVAAAAAYKPIVTGTMERNLTTRMRMTTTRKAETTTTIITITKKKVLSLRPNMARQNWSSVMPLSSC